MRLARGPLGWVRGNRQNAWLDAGKKRNWCGLAHGKNNSIFQAGMSVEDEGKYLQDVVETITTRADHQRLARAGSPRPSRRRGF